MKEIIELLNTLTDDIIDSIPDTETLKPILEMSADILDSSISGFSIALKITNKIRIYKFKSFLEGINKACIANGKAGTELKEKLINCSRKKFYKEYIANVYESAVSAKSMLNAAILGYYLANNAFLNKDISIDQIIICKALSELTDFETELFIAIYKKDKIIHDFRFIDPRHIENPDLDIFTMQLVTEALKNYRIVGRGIGGFELSEQFGVCILNQTSDVFYNLVSEFYGNK